MNAQCTLASGRGAAPPLRQTLLLLERLHKQLAGALGPVLAREQVNLAEWLIVSEVARGDASLSRIASRLARDPGSLSRAITRLIKRKLLQSARSGADRRRATLQLTPSGRAVHQRLARGVGRIGWPGLPASSPVAAHLVALLQSPHDSTTQPPAADEASAAPTPVA